MRKINNTDESSKINFAKLLGFDGVSNQISGPVDFQDETINAKLGAKVGTEALIVCDLCTGLAANALKGKGEI
jgi:hypothetical protein